MADDKKCCQTVYPQERWGSFHGHQCRRKGVVERDGKLYCKQHDPVAVKARDRAADERYDAKLKARRAPLVEANARADAAESRWDALRGWLRSAHSERPVNIEYKIAMSEVIAQMAELEGDAT